MFGWYRRWGLGAKRLVTRASTPAFRLRNRCALGRRYRAAARTVHPFPLALPSGPILLVHPHVDDETIASGGVLLACAARGTPVDLVYTTDSSAGGTAGTPQERARLRRYEADRLAEVTGIRSVRVLSGVNERLEQTADVVANELAEILTHEDYSAVFVVGPIDAHHEHRTSAAVISAALLAAAYPGDVHVGENSTLLPVPLVTHALALDRHRLRQRDELFGLFRSQRTMGFEVFHDLARAKRHLTPGAYAAELYHRTDAAGYARLIAAVGEVDADRSFPHRIGNSWSLARALRPMDPTVEATLLEAAHAR